MRAIRRSRVRRSRSVMRRRRASPAPDSRAPSRQCWCASARPASTRSTPTSAPARTRASRRCPTPPAPTAPARSKRVGADVKGFTPGDRVYIAGDNASAASARAPTPSRRSAAPTQLHRLPPNASRSRRARRSACRTRTAYRALFQRANAQAGETVLVHGATGGVGIAAVELARAHGMTVIGTGGTRRAACRRSASTAPTSSSITRTPDYLDDDHAGDRRPRRRRHRSRWPRTSTSTRISRCSRAAAASWSSATADASRSIRAAAMGRDAAILGMTLFNASDRRPRGDPRGDRRRPRRTARSTRSSAARCRSRTRPRAHEAVMEPGALGKIVLTV